MALDRSGVGSIGTRSNHIDVLQAKRLWTELYDIFDTDDGSLPGIDINNLCPQEVGSIYHFLRTRSILVGSPRHPETGRPCFWHESEQHDVDLDAVPNAALLVAEGTAAAFHIVVKGLTFLGATIPDFGVFVFSESIVLDYRMGKEWGPAQVAALFECLRHMKEIAPSAEITLPEGELPEVRLRFERALWHYCNNGAV